MTFSFMGGLALNDLVMLAGVGVWLVVILTALRQSQGSNWDWGAPVLTTVVTVLFGCLNFVINWAVDSFYHAWTFALIWPGVLMLPLSAVLMTSAIARFFANKATRQKAHAAKKRAEDLRKNHDTVLSELRAMSDDYKRIKPAEARDAD